MPDNIVNVWQNNLYLAGTPAQHDKKTMPPQESEQFLEWTFPYRTTLFEQFWQIIFSIILLLIVGLILRLPEMLNFIFIGVFCFAPIIMKLFVTSIALALKRPRPNRILRMDRQMMILTDTNAWGIEERKMNVNGANVSAASLCFFDRIFTFDSYRVCSAYHVKIARNDEMFFFPCRDEGEQNRIIKQIKELITLQ